MRTSRGIYVSGLVLVVLVAAARSYASPVQPLKHTAWDSIAAEYEAQAAANGHPATCTPYSPSAAMGCRFGAAGRVRVNPSTTFCVYNAIVFYPGGTFKARITYCGPAWDKKTMPAPWNARKKATTAT